MKKYKILPEVVLAGFRDGVQVPEIKVKFNKGKKMFGAVNSSDEVAKFLKTLYGSDIETQEKVIILYLNKRNEIIGYYKHSVGGIDSSIMDLKLIISTALKSLATSMILSHNHPSGNKNPSEIDKGITTKINTAAKGSDIRVLDHVIVTKNNGYYSFADEGALNGINGLSKTTPMKITINNYFSVISNVKFADLPSSFKEIHELLAELTENGKTIAPYNELEKELKEVFELYFSKLSLWIDKNGAVKMNVPAKSNVSKSEKKHSNKAEKKKASAPKKEKAPKKIIEDNTKMVENIDPEIRFIKRYIALKGKSKSKEDIFNFLLALQKSILKKEIRKTSPYAEQINHLQTQLIKAHGMMNNNNVRFDIEEKTFAKYSEIAKSERIMLSVTYIKQYLNLIKTPTKEKAKRLLELIKKAIHVGKIPAHCMYMDELKRIQSSLSEFISTGSFHSVTEQELRGLMGICKCNGAADGLGVIPTAAGIVIGKHIDKVQEKNNSQLYSNDVEVINSHDIVNKEFQTLKLQGKWKALIGEPSPNFSMMIYGPPKCKKSTLAIEFAKYLAANHGKVLYAAFEEGIGETLREKIHRLNAIDKNLTFSNGLPSNLNAYNFVFVDSVNRAKLSYENLLELKQKHPKTAFIYILQVTKDGKYRGSQEIEHEVDVIIHCDENQVAHSNGRFSQGGELEI